MRVNSPSRRDTMFLRSRLQDEVAGWTPDGGMPLARVVQKHRFVTCRGRREREGGRRKHNPFFGPFRNQGCHCSRGNIYIYIVIFWECGEKDVGTCYLLGGGIFQLILRSNIFEENPLKSVGLQLQMTVCAQAETAAMRDVVTLGFVRLSGSYPPYCCSRHTPNPPLPFLHPVG